MEDRALAGSIDILAIGPHPDDVEIGCAATLAKACAAGSRVVICDLTAGEMGTNGSPALRAAEAAEAARRLGAQRRLCLGLPDAQLGYDPGHAAAVASLLRLLRPRLLLAPWGEGDRHPDHCATYEITRRAVFLAGLTRFEAPPLCFSADGGEGDYTAVPGPYRVTRLFYYLINSPARPHVLVDVSEHYEYKRLALAAFDSQFGWRAGVRPGAALAAPPATTLSPGAQAQPTPLNDGVYLPGVEGRDASFGRHAGVAFAEGFISDRYPCLDNLLDVISSR